MQRARVLVTPMLGGVLGALLFLATLGPAIVRPTNLGWLMRHDTQTYLLAWHHFRREPWQWPPGKILGVGYPVTTSIGNTDAIPLVAFLLKPLHPLLPDPGQYLGAWLLTCYVLQGVFGALLVRLVTADRTCRFLARRCSYRRRRSSSAPATPPSAATGSCSRRSGSPARTRSAASGGVWWPGRWSRVPWRPPSRTWQ